MAAAELWVVRSSSTSQAAGWQEHLLAVCHGGHPSGNFRVRGLLGDRMLQDGDSSVEFLHWCGSACASSATQTSRLQQSLGVFDWWDRRERERRVLGSAGTSKLSPTCDGLHLV